MWAMARPFCGTKPANWFARSPTRSFLTIPMILEADWVLTSTKARLISATFRFPTHFAVRTNLSFCAQMVSTTILILKGLAFCQRTSLASLETPWQATPSLTFALNNSKRDGTNSTQAPLANSEPLAESERSNKSSTAEMPLPMLARSCAISLIIAFDRPDHFANSANSIQTRNSQTTCNNSLAPWTISLALPSKLALCKSKTFIFLIYSSSRSKEISPISCKHLFPRLRNPLSCALGLLLLRFYYLILICDDFLFERRESAQRS